MISQLDFKKLNLFFILTLVLFFAFSTDVYSVDVPHGDAAEQTTEEAKRAEAEARRAEAEARRAEAELRGKEAAKRAAAAEAAAERAKLFAEKADTKTAMTAEAAARAAAEAAADAEAKRVEAEARAAEAEAEARAAAERAKPSGLVEEGGEESTKRAAEARAAAEAAAADAAAAAEETEEESCPDFSDGGNFNIISSDKQCEENRKINERRRAERENIDKVKFLFRSLKSIEYKFLVEFPFFEDEVSFPGFGKKAEGRESLKQVESFIQALFKILFVIAGITSVIAIVYHGASLIIASSAGNPEKIRESRKGVINVVIALVIILSTYILLNTVSPKFTSITLETAIPN